MGRHGADLGGRRRHGGGRHQGAPRDARLEPQHDPHAPGAARREGRAGLRRRRVAVHLPRRRHPPAVRAPGRPLVPREGVRRRRRGARRALRRGIPARSRPDRTAPSIARPQKGPRGEAIMITVLDTLGPAIWRASWQAAALAVLVVLLLRCFGERLSPRWRFLMWGVVLTRLLCVATPVSPWSVFNLVPRYPEAGARPIAHHAADAMLPPTPHRPDTTAGPDETGRGSPRVTDSAPASPLV